MCNYDCLSCQPEDIVIDGPGCDRPREVDTELVHLPSCNMFRYKPTPLPKALDFPDCPVRQPNRCDKN